MPDWQERITRESAPALRVEHELRYRVAAPLIERAALWCDLGCGNGVAAARALGGASAEHTILVDVDEGALEAARRELGGETRTVHADLSDPASLETVRAALLEHAAEGTRVVTCLETLEHLESFPGLVALLTELAEEQGFTVLLSVPNDAFWSLENPHHPTTWGEGAFEELRALLPADRIVAYQLPLQGSVVAREGVPGAHDVAVTADPAGVASHFLVVFGPAREQVSFSALVSQADLEDKRRWERQRESDLVYHLDYLSKLEREVEALRTEVRAQSKEIADTLGYVDELEGRLGGDSAK
jgi:2-polyprenyl-3-methyl-5-hydroxy-6-metoxy-1,4-benzoquinol methylase